MLDTENRSTYGYSIVPSLLTKFGGFFCLGFIKSQGATESLLADALCTHCNSKCEEYTVDDTVDDYDGRGRILWCYYLFYFPHPEV